MKDLGGDRTHAPTDPTKEDKIPQIPEVPQFLIPYLFMGFQEGYLSPLKEEPCWEVDHYKDTRQYPPLKTIALYTYKDKSTTWQAVSEEGHEDLRAIRKVKRAHDSIEIEVLEILTKNEDNKWTTLSSDQSPSDQQP